MNKDTKDFIKQYMVTALWSSTDEREEAEHEFLDAEFSIHDFSYSATKRIIRDCKEFIEKTKYILNRVKNKYSYESAGHDFWLTRNRHGAGFWDRFDELSKEDRDFLTDMSEYGPVNLYAENGKVHIW